MKVDVLTAYKEWANMPTSSTDSTTTALNNNTSTSNNNNNHNHNSTPTSTLAKKLDFPMMRKYGLPNNKYNLSSNTNVTRLKIPTTFDKLSLGIPTSIGISNNGNSTAFAGTIAPSKLFKECCNNLVLLPLLHGVIEWLIYFRDEGTQFGLNFFIEQTKIINRK